MSGRLIMNALVMYDRETDSLWSQFLGKAIAGPFKGTDLEIIPSQLTNYGSWVEAHPDTKVLDTHTNYPIDDHYLSYYREYKAGILGEEHSDDRLRLKDIILGVNGDQGQIAYNYLDLLATGVINHEFEGTPIVAAVDREGGGTAIFRRTVEWEGAGVRVGRSHNHDRYRVEFRVGQSVRTLAVSGSMKRDPTRTVPLHHFLLVRVDGLLSENRPVRTGLPLAAERVVCEVRENRSW